jgi:hypothetical protein
MFPPNKQPIIIDAVGTHKYKSDSVTTKTISTNGKYNAFSEMINIDVVHGSTHYLAYYNRRISKKEKVYKDWFIAPLSNNLSFLKSKNKNPINVNDLVDAIPLNEMVV